MSETTLIFTPSIGQPWPEQGGIYIGSRLIDGQTHHVIIPGGTEYDIRANYNNAAERIAAKGEINGFSDWHHGSQEDVMLAYINVPDLFCRGGIRLDPGHILALRPALRLGRVLRERPRLLLVLLQRVSRPTFPQHPQG